MWTDAARAVGFTGAPREHLVVVLPRNAYTSKACAAYGLGSIGAGPDSPGYAYVTDTEPSLWAHELGHNLGLGHANLLSSATASDVAWNGSAYPGATRVGYGDVWDVMSFSGRTIGHGNLGIAGQYRLGLLPAGDPGRDGPRARTRWRRCRTPPTGGCTACAPSTRPPAPPTSSSCAVAPPVTTSSPPTPAAPPAVSASRPPTAARPAPPSPSTPPRPAAGATST